MKKTISLLAAAALVAGCSQNLDVNEVRSALPKPESIQIGTPGASSPGALTAQAVPGYGSEFALVSYWTAVTVNTGVWWTLFTLRVVTLFPPTSHGADSASWGPVLGDDHLNYWRLTVTKQGGGFGYVLDARKASAAPADPFVTLISGVAFPGADEWHGSGNFTIHFDAADQLDHPAGWQKEDHGDLAITYDNTGALSIEATLVGGRNHDTADPFPMNAAYDFEATGAGGDLQVAFANLDTSAELALHTRWDATGAGRGDAQYMDAFALVSSSECWAGAAASFALVYDTHPTGGGPPYGLESDCAYPSFSPPTLAP